MVSKHFYVISCTVYFASFLYNMWLFDHSDHSLHRTPNWRKAKAKPKGKAEWFWSTTTNTSSTTAVLYLKFQAVIQSLSFIQSYYSLFWLDNKSLWCLVSVIENQQICATVIWPSIARGYLAATMYSEWASFQYEIQTNSSNISVLHSYPDSVGKDVACSVVKAMAQSLSHSVANGEASNLSSEKQVQWTMEVCCSRWIK